MSYNSNSLIMRAHGAVEGTFNVWEYLSADALNVITGAAYFSDGGKRGMLVGDIVWVVNQSSPATQPPVKCVVTNVGSQNLGGTLTQNTTATVSLAEFPSNYGPLSNPRNMLDGADATTNPWQRGTSITGIVATNTYTADRWFMVAGAASSAAVVKTADTTVPGFSQSFVLSRASGGASVSSIFFGQALESVDSIRAQGQPVTLSFWARANAGYTGGPLGVQVSQGLGTDQSASALVNGTWTTQSNVVSATQALTSTMTRYSFTGTVGVSATQLGVLFNFTPTGTSTGNDGITINGMQLEIGPVATPFEHREVEQELAYCQRYFFQINETSTAIIAAGAVGAANAETFFIPLPVQMRAAPTVSVVAGSFAVQVSGATAAVSGFAAGGTHTPNYISVVSTTTATAGLAALLVSRQTNSGSISVSADL